MVFAYEARQASETRSGWVGKKNIPRAPTEGMGLEQENTTDVWSVSPPLRNYTYPRLPSFLLKALRKVKLYLLRRSKLTYFFRLALSITKLKRNQNFYSQLYFKNSGTHLISISINLLTNSHHNLILIFRSILVCKWGSSDNSD